MKFALAGNPNSGKTTLFNTLTGSTAHVGNWPGVTVDKRSGVYKKLNENVEIIDLPGIYSLSPYTPEEIVSRNFIIDEKPDCIINVVDATNLERNLYLTTQLLEIDIPVVVALNMIDLVRKNGDNININGLSKALGVPVVEISALRSEGIKELMETGYKQKGVYRHGTSVVSKSSLSSIVNEVKDLLDHKGVSSPLFHAIKLIEGDSVERNMHPDLLDEVENLKQNVDSGLFEGDFEGMIADARYKYISNNYSSLVKKIKRNQETKSDKIDKVLTNKFLGILIFIFIMFVIFHFVFSEDFLFLNGIFKLEITNPTVINFFTGMGYEGEALAGIPSIGVFLQSWMGYATGSLIDLFASFMPEGTWYTSLVCDGILTGLDAVFSFLPQILILFLFISILEDSGYMARVAFIMDRAFRRFGLSGRAFIPLLMGFGCSVPAILNTKTLEDQKERDLTIRLTPFFSCGAKAPIWGMLAGCVAGSFLGDVFVFSIYLLGIFVAIIVALLIKLCGKQTEVAPFIMELPTYHLPQPKNVCAHLWEKLKHFVKKAATIITSAIILIWFLQSFSFAIWEGMLPEDAIDQSILASLGKVIQYIFYPCGWAIGPDGWKYTVATITGLIAKEDVIATMATLGLTEGAINLSNAGIYAFAAYNLFTLPCFATIATAKSTSSKKGFIVTIIWWLGVSYIVSALIYLLGTSFEYNVFLGIIITIIIITLFILFVVFKTKKRALS